MFPSLRILVSLMLLAAGAGGLVACGQQGPLYLPTDPAAAQRATLPQSLLRPPAAAASSARSTP
ncbi:MAG: hypothetical protein FGM55_00045 [Rhodoferax sp.]|nr:hypothetical protein [Rhodoferax sp.]